MAKKIDCYLDCVSPYSFLTFKYLTENAAALASLGVEIEFIPVFLGGINVASGNKPPWTLPAKASYGKYDGKRAQRYFGESYEVPSFFPILSLLPQRALTYIKQSRDRKTLESSFLAIFQGLWKEHLELSKPENLVIALGRVFPEKEVQEIITAAGSPKIKAELQETTEYVVKEKGAFGCPWFWVRNGEKEEPFFGSDRFHYMWDFLEIPHEDLKLKAKI